jgi:hypothetical protein
VSVWFASGPATLLPSTKRSYNKLTFGMLLMRTFNCGNPDSVRLVLPNPHLAEAGLQTQYEILSLGCIARLPILKLTPLITTDVSDHD